MGRVRSCQGKQAHDTKAEAQAQLRSLIFKRGAFGGRLNVYRCKFCSKYHVGHKQRHR